MITPAYIAGFLDGEGYICILRRNRYIGRISYGLTIGFTNRDVRPLIAIQEIYGGWINPKQRKSEKHARAYELKTTNRECVRKLLEDVLPFLIIKKSQAELGLAFLQLGKVKKVMTIPKGNGRAWPVFQISADDESIREQLKQQLGKLNERGPQSHPLQ